MQPRTNGDTLRTELASQAGRDAPDADPTSRPGVPMYGRPDEHLERLPAEIPQQPTTVPVLVGVEVGRLTPVFGTSCPPKGLSGVVRRAAYNIPEHSAGRWMLLLLGDRIDIWESRMRRHPVITATAVLGLGAALFWPRPKQTRAEKIWAQARKASRRFAF